MPSLFQILREVRKNRLSRLLYDSVNYYMLVNTYGIKLDRHSYLLSLLRAFFVVFSGVLTESFLNSSNPVLKIKSQQILPFAVAAFAYFYTGFSQLTFSQYFNAAFPLMYALNGVLKLYHYKRAIGNRERMAFLVSAFVPGLILQPKRFFEFYASIILLLLSFASFELTQYCAFILLLVDGYYVYRVKYSACELGARALSDYLGKHLVM